MQTINEHLAGLGVELNRGQRICRKDDYSLTVLRQGNRLGTAVVKCSPDGTIEEIYYASASNLIADIPNDIAFATVAPEKALMADAREKADV